MDVIDWLLDSDPALRWQVERDLADAPESVWQATRARVRTEGFGARLLALQGADGQWAGGAFFPGEGHRDPVDDGPGQPWIATTPSLSLLREWGMDAAALAGTVEKLAANSTWEYDGSPYWQGEVDWCINAETLANGGWLGADVSGLARFFVDHRMPDGGWNCEWVDGATVSSFHSTVNALRGLLAYERFTGASDVLREARRTGEAYLLERRLLFALSSGDSVGAFTAEFAYPFRWPYSALTAVDYFLSAALFDGAPADPRIEEAIDLVRSKRLPDGRWLQDVRHPGRVWFEVDAPAGEPSKWVTFFATRALQRWDALA
ncbi:MAG: squalene cyclase [Microbacterium sp.]